MRFIFGVHYFNYSDSLESEYIYDTTNFNNLQLWTSILTDQLRTYTMFLLIDSTQL